MGTKTNNLWRLDKDTSIKTILLLLQHETGPNSFMLLDEDQLSDNAVRVVSADNPKELSAYIYSYAQRVGRYGLDLEFPHLIETRNDDQTIPLNNLSGEEIAKYLIEHLELQPRLEQ